MARPKLGDVVEFKTKYGLAYAQYTHKHELYGALLQVFRGFHDSRPDSFADVVGSKPMFICFFPLGAAVSRKIVSIAANAALSQEARQFPIFRVAGLSDPVTWKVRSWRLWDGTNEWKVGDLTPAQRTYPILGVWNDSILIERIETGWRSEDDPR